LEAIRFIGADELVGALGFAEATDALERAFRDFGPDVGPPRSHLAVPGGELLLMPGFGSGGVGVKLVTLGHANPAAGLPFIHGVYVLFDPVTLAPTALIDGAGLTAIRTAAVSALATRHLARADARTLVIFGSGAQARAHVDAIRAVRPIEHVAIVGRDQLRAQRLVDELRREGIEAVRAAADAVGRADVVCTCTTSRTPLFPAAALAAGAHVNAIGAYRPDAREVAGELVASALLVVETRAAALHEAGDVLLAIADGTLARDAVRHELAAVVRGEVRRSDDRQVTLFKSVGLALEDLAIAIAAAEQLDGPGDGRRSLV